MQTVKVRLRKPSRVFTFLSNDIPLERKDGCVVKTDRGIEYGECVTPPEECTAQEEERFKMTVLRRATPYDEETYDKIREDEVRAKRVCKERIQKRNLAMKLVECEYMFDRKKIIFYFTAEDRVDFRQLVRDLAQELKARIELRHIQVRDEAKIVGGIGSCGRELCCTTWMREFIPISMKMAKRQNLSLNPSKISGQCGRLLCCLSYENELYAKAKRKQSADKERLAELRGEMEADEEVAATVATGPDASEGVDEAVAEDDDRGSVSIVDRRDAQSKESSERPDEPGGASRGESDAPGPAKDSSPSSDAASDQQKPPRRQKRRGGRRRKRKRRGS